jgi:hypothetical protein
MIAYYSCGGLGNQLFQWANAYSLSRELNCPFFIDIGSHIKNGPHNTDRAFQLNQFPNITGNIFDPSTLKKPIIVSEHEYYKYQKFILTSNIDYYLVGYWQSYRYFEKYRNDIISNLKIDINNIDIIDTNSVSMHIRRSDYLTSNGYHTIQDINYYQKALSHMPNYDYLLIFSDDIDWCKTHLQFKNMIFVENNNDIADFLLMSKCKHNIIANSSFSWWAAWLNTNHNKIVICPNNWTQLHKAIDTDLIPKDWICI